VADSRKSTDVFLYRTLLSLYITDLQGSQK
jgi:hypothetical protein